MKHGVEFKVNNVKMHTLDNWGMLFSPFAIPSPKVKAAYIELEGADGSIDATEIDGNVCYKDLSFSLEFTAYKGDYNELLRSIKAFLHGRNAQITIYNDPGYYYLGRCEVDEFKSNGKTGKVIINVIAKPYKFKQEKTAVETVVNGTKTVVFTNDSMRTVPTFKASAAMKLNFGTGSYSIGTTETKVADIIFGYGDNVIEFEGDGSVTVTYQEGSL